MIGLYQVEINHDLIRSSNYKNSIIILKQNNMKKLMYTFVLLFAVSVIFTGCREEKSTGEKIEDGIEEVGDGIEDAADEVEDAID